MELEDIDFERAMAGIAEAERHEALLIASRLQRTGVERTKAIRIAVVAARHTRHDRHAARFGGSETIDF